MAFLRSEYNFSKRYTRLRDPTIPRRIENAFPWPRFGPAFFRQIWPLEPALQCAVRQGGNVSSPGEITETALAHVIGDKAEQASAVATHWRSGASSWKLGPATASPKDSETLFKSAQTKRKSDQPRPTLNRSSQSGPNRYP